MSDSEAKKKRRLARKQKHPGVSKRHKTVRRYTQWEQDAMDYHNVVKQAYLAGKITEDQARTELKDAAKAAADNLEKGGAPEILVAVVEQLVLHGSYEAVQAYSKQAESELENGTTLSAKG